MIKSYTGIVKMSCKTTVCTDYPQKKVMDRKCVYCEYSMKSVKDIKKVTT